MLTTAHFGGANFSHYMPLPKKILYAIIVTYNIPLLKEVMDKNVESIIENIDFSMKMEDMPLTEDDKHRLRNCITGKADINRVLQETIKKYKIKDIQMNNKLYEFEAEIKKVPDIDGAYIEIPFDVKNEFGKGRVKVLATFDNESYEGSMVKMGTPCHIIGIRKEIRKKINKRSGEKIKVTIQERE
jgi:tetrahydromethanopterin S-methyltransferase subunit H